MNSNFIKVRIMMCGVILIALFFVWPLNQISFHSDVIGYDRNISQTTIAVDHNITLEEIFSLQSDMLYGIIMEIPPVSEKIFLNLSIEDSEGTILHQNSYEIEVGEETVEYYLSVQKSIQPNEEYLLKVTPITNGEVVDFMVVSEDIKSDTWNDYSFTGTTVQGNLVVEYKIAESADLFETAVCYVVGLLLMILFLFGDKVYKNKTMCKIVVFEVLFVITVVWWYRVNVLVYLRNQYPNVTILYFLIVLIMFLISLIVTLVIARKIVRIETYCIIATILWGSVYLLLFPGLAAPDDSAHFASANYYANQVMGIETHDESNRIMMRESDVDFVAVSVNKTYMEEYYSGLLNDTYVEEGYSGTEGRSEVDSFWFNYMPQTIGVIMARLLQVNGEMLVILGRMTNLLFYCIMVYFTMKWLPFGKEVFFVIMQFPMLLELVSSYSYDAISIGTCFLYIAYLLKLIYGKERVTRKNMVVAIILGGIMTPVKVVYTPLIGLIFLVSHVKYNGTKRELKVLKSAAIMVALLAILFVNSERAVQILGIDWNVAQMSGISISYAQEPDSELAVTVVEQSSTEAIVKYPVGTIETTESGKFYTFSYFMEEKGQIVTVAFSSFFDNIDSWYQEIVGGRLGSLDVSIHSYLVTGFWFFLLLAIMNHMGQEVRIRKRELYWGYFMASGCVVALLLVFLLITSTLSTRIEGIQGRYLIPCLGVFAWFGQGIKLFARKLYDRKIIFIVGTFILNVLVVLEAFEVMIGR